MAEAASKGEVKFHPSKVDWARVREDYIVQNLDPNRERPYTLKEVAEKWHVSYGHVRNIASEQKWREQLREHAQKRADESIEEARKAIAFDEAEIRVRQQKLARLAQALAGKKLQEIVNDPDLIAKMSPREATELLRIGLDQERNAVGLPREYAVTELPDTEDDKYESPLVKMRRHQRMKVLGERLMELMQEDGPDGDGSPADA